MKKLIILSSILILIGFVSFLFFTKSTINAAEIVESKDKFVAAKSGLNLRSDPGKSSKVLSSVPYGSKVTVEKSEGDEIFLDGRYGKWVNVKYGNKTGWVFSGFLCDFEPDTVKKPVADYYLRKYKNEKGVDRGLCADFVFFRLEGKHVYVASIIENYIHLKIPSYCGERMFAEVSDVIWRYDAKQKKFFEVYNFGYIDSDSYFLYLDKDKYPDMVVKGYLSGEWIISIFLGTENGFKKVYDMKNDCNSHFDYYFSEGSCGEMKFVCGKKNEDKKSDAETMYFFKYNCDKKKIEKYAESKIIRAEGRIKSIDIKNMSVVIEDYRDDTKSFTYKFSAKRFSSNEDIKYLKIFKKDAEIEFSYEIIDGKKMILDIYWMDLD